MRTAPNTKDRHFALTLLHPPYHGIPCSKAQNIVCKTMLGVVDNTTVFLGMRAIIASPAMRHVLELVRRVAQSNASVLIQGESGSGKELIARAVHHYSLRASKPWVDVSCAALPEHLVESELFGYEKGAFSGADSAKAGLFEMAHCGTLFLDEIGELEPRMQVKLLRVLDGASYFRLGGVRKVSVDVRIIAATNQPVQDMIQTGGFRGDLFHRLSQVTLEVPPLRERPEDILPLAEYFLQQQNPRARFLPGAVAALRSHSWPGNIRELRNAVTKAALFSASLQIDSTDLPLQTAMRIVPQPVLTMMPSPSMAAGPRSPHNESANLDGMERRMILQVLAQTQGHHQKAADLLGISRRTLSRKLKLYGMEAARETCAS